MTNDQTPGTEQKATDAVREALEVAHDLNEDCDDE